MRGSRFFLLSAVMLLMAVPTFAQTRSVDISAFATWVDPQGDTLTVDDDEGDFDVDTNFDSDQGFGAAINVFWGNRISSEFAASVVEPEGSFNDEEGNIGLGGLEMIPITATLQFHLAPNATFDPYIGAGVAYVLFDEADIDFDDADEEINVRAIDFDDDYGFVLNAGANVSFGALGLYLDAKYVPVESSVSAVFAGDDGDDDDDDETADFGEVEVNPLMLSAGLSFRF